jgi:Cu/Ag efflux pump CusA
VQVTPEEPRVEIIPKLAECREHGIKPGDVRRAAATLLSGIEVGSLFQEQKVFEVVVWSKPELRDSLTKVKELLIDAPTGQVRLEEVADVRVVSGPTVVEREAVARFLDVTADVRGRDLASVGRDVKAGLREINFPLEYRAELLGAPAERLAAKQRLWAFALAAAIGIVLLLQAAFGSWRLATLVFLLLPLALVGGLVAAFATGGDLSVGVMAGLFAVLGLAVRNCVLLIHRYQQLATGSPEEQVDPEVAEFRSQFDQASHLDELGKRESEITPELVLRGTQERLVPILLTAAAVALAFLPFLLLGDIAGLEIARPTAIVILGGLVTATLVSLLVLPALYLWLKVKPARDLMPEAVGAQTKAEQLPAPTTP